jgi:hypothetical protein
MEACAWACRPIGTPPSGKAPQVGSEGTVEQNAGASDRLAGTRSHTVRARLAIVEGPLTLGQLGEPPLAIPVGGPREDSPGAPLELFRGSGGAAHERAPVGPP